MTLDAGHDPARISAECSVIGIMTSPKAKALNPFGYARRTHNAPVS